MSIIFNDLSDDIIITATKLRSNTTQNLNLDASDNNLKIDASNITLNHNDLSINTIHASEFKILYPHNQNTYLTFEEYFNIMSKDIIDLTGSLDASLNNVDISGNLIFNVSSKLIFNNGSAISISNDNTLLIDPTPANDSSGTLIIQGDLQVIGNKTTIYSSLVDISDKTFNIAYGATTTEQANQAGIVIGTSDLSLSITYNNDTDRFVFSKSIDASGDITYNSLNIDSITIKNTDVSNSTIKNGLLGNIIIGSDLITSDTNTKLFASKSTFAIENSANTLLTNISDVSNKWISPSGYINSINLNSKKSAVLVEFNVNYKTSPEAEQTISFKVTRGLSAEDVDNIVFQDCSLGSNMAVTLNDIYNGSFIDTDPSFTPYEISGGKIISTFTNKYGFDNNTRTQMSLSDDGSIIVIADWGAQNDNNRDDNINGKVTIYKKKNNSFNNWAFDISTITPNKKVTDDNQRFGSTVSLSNDGKTLVISEISDGQTNTANTDGSVHIYTILDSNRNFMIDQITTLTVPPPLNAYGGNDGSYYGSTIALSGDGNILAVYADKVKGDSKANIGYVFIYKYNDISWVPINIISRNSLTNFYVSGTSILQWPNNDIQYGKGLKTSYNGHIIFVPYIIRDNNAYYVDIYVYNSITSTFDFTKNLYLTFTFNARPNIYSSGDGNRLVVGNTSKTSVHIYDTSDNWINHTRHIQEIDTIPTTSTDYLGTTVCLSYNGNVLFVGDPSIKPGYIYIYEYNDDIWEKKNTIIGPNPNNSFGYKFAISPNSAILLGNNGRTTNAPYKTGKDTTLYNVKNPTDTAITPNPIPVLYSLHYRLDCSANDNIDTSYGILSNGYNNIFLQELYVLE